MDITNNAREQEKTKRVLILGSSGFMGNRLKEFFQQNYPDIEIIGKSSNNVDLTKIEEVFNLKDLFDQNTVVIMCSGIKSNYGNDIESYAKNVAMAENVSKILLINPVKKFIFFSSIAVYGVDNNDTKISEQTPAHPDTYYGLSKFVSERILSLALSKQSELSKHTKCSLVILRIPTIYGPGEKIRAHTPSGFLSTYLNDEEITLWGDGSELREFLFLEDLVKIVDAFVFNNFKGIINPSSGKSCSYKEALDTISKILNKQLVINSKPRTKDKVDKLYDNTLFKKILPDFSFTSIEEGLKEILRKTRKDSSCNLCHENKVKESIDFGLQPICNRFLEKSNEEEKLFNLKLGQCQSCGLVQLVDPVSFQELIPKHNWITYLEPEEHLDALALKIKNLPELNKDSKIMGISFKDESLVTRLKELGLENAITLKPVDLGIGSDLEIGSVGTEKAENVGVETIQDKLTSDKCKEHTTKRGYFDVVIARHVLEHAYNLTEFIKALKELVSFSKYIVLEVPDCTEILDTNNYPMIWEEHVSYFTEETLNHLLRLNGLEVVHFEKVLYALESSLIVIVTKREEKEVIGDKEQVLSTKLSTEQLVKERKRMENFTTDFILTKNKIEQYLAEIYHHNQKRERVAMLGAGHLACGFINFFNISKYIECIIDDNKNKVGLFMPGSKLPIYSSSILKDKNINIVLLSVNPRNELKVFQKNNEFLNGRGKIFSIFSESEHPLPIYQNSKYFNNSNDSILGPVQRCKMERVYDNVFIARDQIVKLNQKDIEFIKEKALNSDKKRARICTHQDSKDNIHEMIIAAVKNGYVQPHKHNQKSESFHMIEGEMDVVIFNEKGNVVEVIEMGEYVSGKRFFYRLSNNSYHTILVKSTLALFHETTKGPFIKGETIFASWSPQENETEKISLYLDRLSQQIEQFKKDKNEEVRETIEKIENNPKTHYQRTSCRLCEGKELELIVPFIPTPIGGAFVSKEDLGKEQESYSLDMYQCKTCGHVQLLDVVDPKILFSNYSYFSGKTGLVKHFSELADKIMQKNISNHNSLNNDLPNINQKPMMVVDIGSNDGAFLQFFKNKGHKVLGVDPAKNVAQFANESGIETIPKMFDLATAQLIRKDYGPADIITANNVFAHTDDMIGMARSVQSLLAEDGLFYFEVSYLIDVINKMLLGAIFHEHLCYHTVKPLSLFLKQQGLELIDVERVPIQGGSLICTAQLIGGKNQISPHIRELIELEENLGVYKPGYFLHFVQKLEESKIKVAFIIKEIKSAGKRIAAYGAARGGTLITYQFNLGSVIDYIVDDNPEKINFYSPGNHIPVLPASTIYEQHPDYVIILAWVHSKAIIEKNRKFLEQGGKFITFFPKVEIVSRDGIKVI